MLVKMIFGSFLVSSVGWATDTSTTPSTTNVFNDKSGFTITKPAEWAFIETNDYLRHNMQTVLKNGSLLPTSKDSYVTVFGPPAPAKYERTTTRVTIQAFPAGRGSLLARANANVKAWGAADNNFSVLVSPQVLLVGGAPAVQFVYSNQTRDKTGFTEQCLHKMTYIVNGNKFYKINMAYASQKGRELEPTLNQILKSVAFKSTTLGDSSGMVVSADRSFKNLP
jgi:hypothetical protein